MLREEPLKHYFCPRATCGRVTAEARGRLRGGVTWCCCERQALLWRLKSKLRTTRPRPTEHPPRRARLRRGTLPGTFLVRLHPCCSGRESLEITAAGRSRWVSTCKRQIFSFFSLETRARAPERFPRGGHRQGISTGSPPHNREACDTAVVVFLPLRKSWFYK